MNSSRQAPFCLILLLVVLALALGSLFYYRAIQHELTTYFILRNPAPAQHRLEQLAASTDTFKFLQRTWVRGQIPHRFWVASYLREGDHPALARRAAPLLREAALDLDQSVRELALATLNINQEPRLAELAAAQLRDVDPSLRIVGIQYLRRHKDPRFAAQLFELLNDSDLQVVTSASAALRQWVGFDSGIRVADAIAQEEGYERGSVHPERVEAIQRGVERWKNWWRDHGNQFPTPVPAAEMVRSPGRIRAGNFSLPDLQGRAVRLSEFRGKIVLLNFWATWCFSCQQEISDLIELQRKQADDLVVLGICVDAIPHGHDHGEEEIRDLNSIRAHVESVAQKRGINYRVLLDRESGVNARFNGHELPTNILIDREGGVRRRFIGRRSVEVLQAMIREASIP